MLSRVLPVVAIAAAVLVSPSPARASDDTGDWWRPRDAFLRPKKPGTRLKIFGFWGPGMRTIVENYTSLEGDMSELHTQLIGDTNFGFAQGSLLADVRVFLLSLGVGAGYRHDWRNFQFEPDASGRDHGSRVLDRDTRDRKDDDVDFTVESFPWVELRTRLVLPGARFMAVSEAAYRYSDRPDNSFDWPLATVFDSGWHLRWETFLFYRHHDFGFIGPAARVLNVPRTNASGNQNRATDLHYGFVFGTRPDWSTAEHVILARVYAAFGLDDDDLMGASFYGAPIQIIVGYQSELEL